ncbi:MFS transporter [Bradyrhizobium symbiodeficiens]|uniref:MFS transporter n=1 Tax=Bradyrhizobium symbiodeficiens TaxID=1404367 RepID=A0ABX5WE41_9BRAD|nr:MFS transporter [Bradyrhizobium symbiodeficiens]AWM05038.1 MFS transporter [Bradyrhizobium symbiodeficiens]QDF41493.1 MFS transporter [Bradyrhizobium symbiodeficiens]
MISKRRYCVYVGLFVLMFINYLDRVNLSVAAKPLSESYGLSPIDMGYIFSAFLWTYLICLIPMGLVADRFGGRAVTYATLGIWSLAGIWTGLATTYSSLFASRLVLGVGESASYPAGGKIIREWAPESERGVAAAFLNSGAHAGLCFGSVVVGSLIVEFGWRESFYLTGAAGVALALLWYLLYRQPEKAAWLSADERDFIVANRGAIAPGGAARLNQLGALKGLLGSSSMWALALTQGCAGYTLYLFMTWLPSYLAASRGMDILKSSLFSAIPYGVAALLGLGLGWFSDKLLKRSGASNSDRRKLIAAMLLLSSVILAAPFVESIWLIETLISVSLACVATAMAMNIALTADLMTDGRYNGVATSLLIMGGNLFGTAAPIVTGYVVAATGGFSGAFLIAGVLLLGGAVVITFGAHKPITLADDAQVPVKRASATSIA